MIVADDFADSSFLNIVPPCHRRWRMDLFQIKQHQCHPARWSHEPSTAPHPHAEMQGSN